MVSCAHRNIQSFSVHIVIACWLYVIAMVALTMKSPWVGVATFAFIGCAPVALYWMLAMNRLRWRRRNAAAQNPQRDDRSHDGGSGDS